jgi:hypothetical protein
MQTGLFGLVIDLNQPPDNHLSHSPKLSRNGDKKQEDGSLPDSAWYRC